MRPASSGVILLLLSSAPALASPPPVAVSTQDTGHFERPSPRRSGRFVQLEGDSTIHVLRPERAWGTPRAVELLREVAKAHRGRFPDAPALVVGDLSRERGGRLDPHRSHRRGRDADVRLPQRGGRELRLAAASQRTIDLERAWFVIEWLVRTGEVEYIFLDRRMQRALRRFVRGGGLASGEQLSAIFQYPRAPARWVGIVRHEPGHLSHFHVRFRRAAVAPPEKLAPLVARSR